jgi:HPr kinase/phosphorylase
MRATIHASCVVLARAGETLGASPDAGVLLLGQSGAGKSDLALRLIERGAVLVSDDRTELSVQDGALIASAPNLLTGLLEVRGLGIVRLESASNAKITVVCELTQEKIGRMPDRVGYDPPPELTLALDMRPALIRLHPFEASAPAKIVAAAADARLRDGRKLV